MGQGVDSGVGLAWGAVLILSFVQLVPFGVCVAQRKMGYLPLLLAVGFVGYTAAPLVSLVRGVPLTSSHVAALLLLILGSCLILVLDQFIRGRWLEDSRARHFVRFEVERGVYFGAIGVFVLSLVLLPRVPENLLRLAQHLQFLLSAFLFCSHPRGAWNRNLIPALLFFGAYYSFLSFSNFSFAINVGAIWVVDACLERRRRPFIGILALFFPLLFLHAVKGEFREALSLRRDASLVEKVVIVTDLALQRVKHPGEGPGFLTVVADRAHDESLEKVMANSPTPVPYWRGESYRNFIVEVWPFGGEGWNVWNLFGRRYGYLGPADAKTEVVFSYFAEGYFNFGYWGFFAVTLFVGILFPCVEKLSEIEGQRFYAFVFIAFLIPLLSYQIDLSSVLVKLIWSAAAVLGPLEWLKRRRLLHHQ